jgi:hypothetical protein
MAKTGRTRALCSMIGGGGSNACAGIGMKQEKPKANAAKRTRDIDFPS